MRDRRALSRARLFHRDDLGTFEKEKPRLAGGNEPGRGNS